ncbi:metallophosphoesterase family protein, partial [Candidatus Venteria ishoeyi]
FAYDSSRGMVAGLLMQQYLSRADIDVFYHRGSLKLENDVLTIGLGNYYFFNASGSDNYTNVSSEKVFTLNSTNGRYVVFRKTSSNYGYIEQKLPEELSENMRVIGYYDTTNGFRGILADEILRQDAEGYFNEIDFNPKHSKTTFFLATDTHSEDVSSYPDDDSKKIYGNFTKQYEDLCAIIERSNAEFYLHTGDVIQTPIALNSTVALSALESVKRAEKGLTMPKYHVSGNHDVNYATWTEADVVAFYGGLEDTFIEDVQSSNFNEAEKLGYYHTIRGQLHIIVLNTNSKDTNRVDAWYDIDATQRAWFISELNSIPNGSYIVIASHVNLRLDELEYSGSADIKDITIVGTTITEIENAMISYLTTNKNSRVVGWLSGHTHVNNIKKVAISTSGGQSELNYITSYRTAYGTTALTYNRTNLSYSFCEFDSSLKKLTITGYGFQDSYELTY